MTVWKYYERLNSTLFFFELRFRTEPPILKYPYIQVNIYPSHYTISMTKYEPVNNYIKESDIYGGW